MTYFERLGRSAFRATGHVGGAWDPDEQHVAPALGLLVHIDEVARTYLPYLVALLLGLALVAAWPDLTLVLPRWFLGYRG